MCVGRFSFWNCVAACRNLALSWACRCCAPHGFFPPSSVDTVRSMATSSRNLRRDMAALRRVEPRHARSFAWAAATPEKGFSAVGQTQLNKITLFFTEVLVEKQPGQPVHGHPLQCELHSATLMMVGILTQTSLRNSSTEGTTRGVLARVAHKSQPSNLPLSSPGTVLRRPLGLQQARVQR